MPISSVINRMRAHADFLALHEALLDELDYNTQFDIAQAERDAEIIRFTERFPLLGAARQGERVNYKQVTHATVYCSYGIEITVSGPNPAPMMRRIRRAVGGTFDKEATSYSFTLRQERDDAINSIRITSSRENVCTPKVVGKEEKVIPAVEAQPERIETVDVVEWECPSILDEN